MFKKLIELIKQAIRNMVKYKDVQNTLSNETIYNISNEMQNAIDLWKAMYKDKAPWLNNVKGVYSLGIAQAICHNLATNVLTEMKFSIKPEEQVSEEDLDENSLAGFLQKVFDEKILNKLDEQLEKGMALGGFIVKPYISGEKIYFDFSYQGQFYPLTFDDDGNITDIAFLDQFISEGKIYTKVERQTFTGTEIIITNKAYVNKYQENIENDLGSEIELNLVDRWASIEPEAVIGPVDRPLYGYYRTPNANNIDLDCPLGISVFSPAVSMIHRADKQFSRLDWEYEGGQMAINVDPTALKPGTDGYYGTNFDVDDLRDRVYRGLDLGSDEAYHEFAPTLRDTNYLAGLNAYLAKIEDICGLSRGALSAIDSSSRTEYKTATEIRIMKQRTYITINGNQKRLEKALKDLVYATEIYARMYSLAPEGTYTVSIDWSDSVLTDINEEIQQKIQLKQEGILSTAEIRSWYTGEDLEKAQQMVDEIKDQNSQGLDDIFTMGRNFGADNTLENNGSVEE